jgi:tetratricopeptide (TPR) repeat protein
LRVLPIILLLSFSISSYAQDSSKVDSALQLSKSGKYNEAENLFNDLLARYPNNTRLLEGRALNRLWKKDYSKAEEDFNTLLLMKPGNVNAQIGLGNVYTGQQRYKEALEIFQLVLSSKESQYNPDAVRGRGYANYKAGYLKKAEKDFLLLNQMTGEQTEWLIALTKIYNQQGEQQLAREIIKKLQKKDRKQYKDLALLVQSSPALIEFTPFLGYSKIDGVERWGVHGAELIIQPTPAIRMWGEYDLELGRDLLSQIKLDIPDFSFYSGGSFSLGRIPRFVTSLEFGHRHFSSWAFQRSFRAEEQVFFTSNFSVKVGGLYAPKSEHIPDWHPTNEYLAYGGFSFPISKKLIVQPSYVYSTDDISKINSHRAMLQANYKMAKGAELAVDGFIGEDIRNIETETPVHGKAASIYIHPNFPVGKLYWISPQFRYSRVSSKELFHAGVAFRFRFEK